MLTDILSALPQNPKKNKPKESAHTFSVFPITTSNTLYPIVERKVNQRLLKTEEAHPATGNATSEPRGGMKRTAPNCASLKENFSITLGIRDAHVAKMQPQQKKKTETANLCHVAMDVFMNCH